MRFAQSGIFAFAIVKAMRGEDLGNIETIKICSEKISMESKKNFTIKHLVKTIKEQIFTGLLIIFPLI